MQSDRTRRPVALRGAAGAEKTPRRRVAGSRPRPFPQTGVHEAPLLDRYACGLAGFHREVLVPGLSALGCICRLYALHLLFHRDLVALFLRFLYASA